MSEIRRVVLEALLLCAAGTAVGLAVNAVSPLGLTLGRDYFLASRGSGLVPAATGTAPAGPPASAAGGENHHAESEAETAAVMRLRALGLQDMPHAEVEESFRSPLRESMAYLFVDARDARHFQEGHIPGALHVDYYQIDRHIEQVLPYCQAAERIIIYCNGGNCDDSELLAQSLITVYGVDPAQVFVYPGGMSEWRRRGLPVERGRPDARLQEPEP